MENQSQQKLGQIQKNICKKYQDSHLDIDTIKNLALLQQKQQVQKQKKLKRTFQICTYYSQAYVLVKQIKKSLKIEDQDQQIRKRQILQYLQMIKDLKKIEKLLEELKQIKLHESLIQQNQFQDMIQNIKNLEQLYVISPEHLKQIKIKQLTKIQVIKILHKKRIQYKSYRFTRYKKAPSLLKQIVLSQLPKVKTVQIQSFFIIHLQLLQLPCLKTVNLSQNKQLTSLKVRNCKNIQYLILNKSGINDACLQQFSLNQLQKLKVLEISGCQNVKNIQIIGLQKLVTLDLSKTYLQSIVLKNLEKLKSINLSHCHCPQLITVQQCLNVKILRLNYSSIHQKILNQLFNSKLPKLNYIELQNSKEILDLNLNSCKKLKKLNLKKTKIKSFALSNCLELIQLDLSHCYYLQNIQIFQCFKLKKLNFQKSKYFNSKKQQNNLQKIINSLPQLQQLNLCQSNIGNSLHLENCQKLKKINFSGTELETLSISSSSNLQRINLTSCKSLKDVSLRNCQYLKQIIINPNSIYRKFKNIANICQNSFLLLKNLDLRGNQICNIQGLSWLMLENRFNCEVDIAQNKVTNIKSLSKLVNFKGTLYLSKNCILDYQPLMQSNFHIRSKIFMRQSKTTYYSSFIFKMQLFIQPDMENQRFSIKVKEIFKEIFKKRYEINL